jgi:signal transduction histidine kinase
MADATQIHQVLMNLGANAGLATRDQGGTLELSTENVVLGGEELARLPELAPGQYVRLVVRDTGTGMTPPVLARVFEPFFTTRAHGEGTGMGLAVAHGIVLNHGGAITADSASTSSSSRTRTPCGRCSPRCWRVSAIGSPAVVAVGTH